MAKITWPVEVKLGGHIFYIHPFGGFYSLKMIGDLQKAFVPIIGGIASGMKGEFSTDELKKMVTKDASLLDSNLSEIGSVLGNATSHLDGDELVRLAKKLLTDDNKIFFQKEEERGSSSPDPLAYGDLDRITTNHPDVILKLMYKVVEANYQDFFSSLGAVFGKAVSELLKKNESSEGSQKELE